MTFNEAEWRRNRRRQIAYGRWQPAEMVSPDRAVAHINGLREWGLSEKTLSRMLGQGEGYLSPFIWANHKDARRKISAEKERQILALRFDLDGLRDEAQVSAAGTRRRIEALGWMGWSADHLSPRLGVTRSTVKAYRSKERKWVQVSTARAIRDLYDELSMQRGPSVKGAAWARKRGWLPPLAWDDDTIDDPAAVPDMDEDRRRIEVEDVEFVLSHNPVMTSRQLAERFGCTPDGIQQACRRAGRTDLLARLARNAEVA